MMSPMLRAELARVREEAGISKRRLALDVGVDPSFITHIDQGSSDPSVEVFEALVRGCGAEVRIVRPTGDAARDDINRRMARMSPDDLRLLVRVAQALPHAGPARASIVEALAQLAGLPAEPAR